MNILVIHGPNLNLLGEREPAWYGKVSLELINEEINKKAKNLNCQLKIEQSNSEGEIIELIHKERKWAKGIIINPAAYTHTSVAIRDAILAVNLPAVEVHLSNIYKREEFRHISFIRPVCIGQICGFGALSYILALEGLVNFLKEGKIDEYRKIQRGD
ncbi:type II 3-dehydroquinate dehydratase [Candidatus Aerophobetes bacterium]|nr:type II 3-dehydroquinate dehydratase [Candidatus Aerophobetes bacterium]